MEEMDMRRRTIEWAVAALVVLATSLPALAQGGKIDLSRLDYSATAVETVEVTLDGPLLRMAAKFMRGQDSDDREIASMIETLQGIYVKSFTFDGPGKWTARDLAAIKAQVGPQWQRIVNVKNRDGEDIEIYFLPKGDILDGIVIVAAEPSELTVVNLVGHIDLDKLSRLENQFGIPEMGLDPSKDVKGKK
jgi:hypothetical protein